MKKRLIALTASLISLAAYVTSTVPYTASAYTSTYTDEEFLEEIQGYEILDREYWLPGMDSDYYNCKGKLVSYGFAADKVYFGGKKLLNDQHGNPYTEYTFITATDLPDVIVYKPSDGKTMGNVAAALRDYNAEHGTEYTTERASGLRSGEYWLGYSYSGRVMANDETKRDLPKGEANKLIEYLSDLGLISEYDYKKDRVKYNYYCWDSLMFHYCCINEVEKYIKEKALDCRIEPRWLSAGISEEHVDHCCQFVVIPNYDASPYEQLKLANEILSNTYSALADNPSGPCLSHIWDESHSPVTPDEHMMGDANCDGAVDLSDAVMIMQYLGNPNKYPLTPQGQYNADVTEDTDGVTAKDALLIQKVVLGLAKFPY